MVNIRKINPAARAIGTVGAVVVLAGGVTFAALSSTATLTDNTVSSATATLQVDNPADGVDFNSTDGGFVFNNLVPGEDYGAAQQFSLKNTGTVDLDVTVYATVGTATGSLDKTKVMIKFTNNSPLDVSEFTLAQLEAVFNNVPGSGGAGTLLDGETENFDIQVKLLPGAVTGSGPAADTGFSLVFTGTNEAEVI